MYYINTFPLLYLALYIVHIHGFSWVISDSFWSIGTKKNKLWRGRVSALWLCSFCIIFFFLKALCWVKAQLTPSSVAKRKAGLETAFTSVCCHWKHELKCWAPTNHRAVWIKQRKRSVSAPSSPLCSELHQHKSMELWVPVHLMAQLTAKNPVLFSYQWQ